MKRALFFLVVLGGCVLVAEFGLRAAAENTAAAFIDKQVDQESESNVTLGKFPFLLSLVTGSFDEVTVSIPRVPEGGLVVENIDLRFRDVRLEALELLGGRGDLRARSLRGRGEISERALNEFVGSRISGVTVTIEDGRVLLSQGDLSAAATAVVASNTLFINADVAGPLEIPLPQLLPGVRFSSLEARGGRLVLDVRADRVRVRT